jgi:superfamily I DNA/RNA helicase
VLNAEQQQAVACRDPRILCLAAPGSGKTRTLVERIADLLSSGWHPSEILAITFTRKAAREVRERVEERLGTRGARLARGLTIQTFHAFCASTLRAYHDVVELDRNFAIRDEGDREDLIKFVGRELGLKYSSWARLWKEEAVRTRYRALLRETRAVDYDELERLMLQLVREHARGRDLRARYRHVLVDEVQDTSQEQQDLLEAIAPDHLFMVGDLAQSIYGFRGARPEGIVRLLSDEQWTLIRLATNYRSHPEIVATATRIAQAMTPPGLDQVAGRAAEGPFPLVTLVHGWHAQIGASIRETKAELGAACSDCAVLAPRWAQLDELAAVLSGLGIPHEVARQRALIWDSAEARWLMNCLRVAMNPWDHVAYWAALEAFRPRVTLREWAEAREAAARTSQSVWVTLDSRCRNALAIARAMEGINQTGTVHLDHHAFEDILDAMREEFAELHLETRLAVVDELERAVCAWGDGEAADGRTFDHRALLDWWAGRNVHDVEPEARPDAVQLMTIHAAKGLEWRAVWVLGCEEGSLPRGNDPERVEEQRRLFYVATTRGRDRVTWCHELASEERPDVQPSRFLGEAAPRTYVVDRAPLAIEDIYDDVPSDIALSRDA